jgi:hypothetical protein
MRISIRPALIEFWEIFRDRENTRLAIKVDSVGRVNRKFDLARFRAKPRDLISHRRCSRTPRIKKHVPESMTATKPMASREIMKGGSDSPRRRARMAMKRRIAAKRGIPIENASWP